MRASQVPRVPGGVERVLVGTLGDSPGPDTTSVAPSRLVVGISGMVGVGKAGSIHNAAPPDSPDKRGMTGAAPTCR